MAMEEVRRGLVQYEDIAIQHLLEPLPPAEE
jgi:hypothetical protein